MGFVKQHHLQCRQLCDTGIGTLGLGTHACTLGRSFSPDLQTHFNPFQNALFGLRSGCPQRFKFLALPSGLGSCPDALGEGYRSSPQPCDHCLSKCLRNTFSFSRLLAMCRPCSKIFAILGLSPSVVRTYANESALGLQSRAQALHTSCFLPATISICSHDPGRAIPNGRSFFSAWASTKKMLRVALAAQLLFALCSCGHSTISSWLYLSAACASCWTSSALQRKSEMRQVTKKMKIAPTSNCPTHHSWRALQVTLARSKQALLLSNSSPPERCSSLRLPSATCGLGQALWLEASKRCRNSSPPERCSSLPSLNRARSMTMSLWRHALHNWAKPSQLCRAMRCTTRQGLPTLLEEINSAMKQAYILFCARCLILNLNGHDDDDQCCRSDKHHLMMACARMCIVSRYMLQCSGPGSPCCPHVSARVATR